MISIIVYHVLLNYCRSNKAVFVYTPLSILASVTQQATLWSTEQDRQN